MTDSYESLSKSQLMHLLRKRDGERRLGLVWERNEIEADKAIDANFVACTPVIEQSDGSAPWYNLIIEGDNFDVLRWLRMTYSRRIKCIYIDPPYNTGKKDWVYNDHYLDRGDAWSHSTWIEFLYRRIELARDLLAPDGVLLVSINDENRARLDMLLEQTLPGMRVGSFVWRTRIGGNEGSEAFLSDNHEHVLAYAGPEFSFLGSEKSFAMYRNFDGTEAWRKSDLTVAVAYTNPRAGNAYYPLQDPETGVWYPCNPDRVWVFASREHSGAEARVKTKFMEDWIAEGRIIFPTEPRVEVWENEEKLLDAIDRGDVPKSGRAPMLRRGLPNLEFWIGKKVGFGTPAFKRYKKDLRNPTQPLSSWITPRAEMDTLVPGANMLVAGTNEEGAKTIKEVFGYKAFDYAKPVSLIRELIRQSTGPGDIVLDFFAGSATTAQAVMELNAEDNGGRRFIMASSTEATQAEPDKNLCRDVAAERVRRLNAAIEGKNSALSAPFIYLRSREIDFANIDYDLTPNEVWAALEALHGLPLTAFDPLLPAQEHEDESQILILVDRVDPVVIARLEALGKRRLNVFVYAWAPGQIRAEISGFEFEVRSVRDVLVKRFQQ